MAEVLTQEPQSSRAPEILKRTAPWVRLMAILMFIGSGLMILGGLVMGLGMAAGSAFGRSDNPFGAMPGLIIGVIYAGFGAVNLVPATYLWRFASHSDAFASGPSDHRLEKALDAQRSYWKFMGIVVIVAFGFCALAIALAIAGAAMFATR